MMDTGKGKVLLRSACLTKFTFGEIELPKGWDCSAFTGVRVDYACDFSEGLAHAEPLENHRPFTKLHEADFAPSFSDQAKDLFGERNVRMIVMDSFTDMFDAVFANRETHAKFFGKYGSFDRSEEFLRRYEIGSRLTLGELEAAYRRFFAKVKKVYGAVPIVYLCFTARFDPRPDYRARCEAIEALVDRLADEFAELHVYHLDFAERLGADDDHPYHYTPETYRRFAEKIVSREPGLSLVWRCPNWLKGVGRLFYEKKKLDRGVRKVRILGMSFSYVTRRKREKSAECA